MTNFNLIINLFFSYVVIMILVYFFSNVLIFQQPKPPSYVDSAGIVKIITDGGKKLSAVYLKNEKAKYTVLYSHGNACDLGYLRNFLENFYNHGYSVLSYDYQGYGTSEGRASEKNTYKDIKAAYDFLVKQKNVDPNNIILIGNSVGAAITLDLATKHKVKAVVLESPFLTAFRTVTVIPLFPFDKYENNKKINKVLSPVLIIHGNRDKTVFSWHGKKLYKMAKEPKKLVIVKNADHNNLYEVMGDDYWNTLRDFCK